MRLLRQGDERYFHRDAQSAITSPAEALGCSNSAHSHSIDISLFEKQSVVALLTDESGDGIAMEGPRRETSR